jgi:hypothetical protein
MATEAPRNHSPALVMTAVLVALAAMTGILAASGSKARPPVGNPAHPFVFGLWGDVPYARSGDDPKMPALIADMNNDRRLAFSVYDGDIKDGSSRCTDEEFTAAVDRFDQLRAPVVYVPGDNEWTDCHRINNGGYGNLERLDHLRRVMFARTGSFGARTMEVEHQGPPTAAYSENTRWAMGGAVFVGLNVPGSNNNKVNSDTECTEDSVRTPADCAADNAEYAARSQADVDWIRQSFARAKATGSRGVMIVMQADPGFDLPETISVDERADPGRDGYTDLVGALIDETRAFAGQVVLVHGDTHFFKLDKPLVDRTHLIPHFTRLETFGSPNVDWVRVEVDPGSRNFFRFEPMVVAANHDRPGGMGGVPPTTAAGAAKGGVR